MGEWVRWLVAMTVYPFLLIDDLIHRNEFERFIAEQKQRLIDLAEGE